jgi:transposase
VRTVRRVLEEEPIPLKINKEVRSLPRDRRGQGAQDGHREAPRRRLEREGHSRLYLRITRDTVYKTLRSWIEEGEAGLEDKKRGRPKGVSKVDLKAIDAVRRLQKNPRASASFGYTLRSRRESAST